MTFDSPFLVLLALKSLSTKIFMFNQIGKLERCYMLIISI
jgi:hypothetical protein